MGKTFNNALNNVANGINNAINNALNGIDGAINNFLGGGNNNNNNNSQFLTTNSPVPTLNFQGDSGTKQTYNVNGSVMIVFERLILVVFMFLF